MGPYPGTVKLREDSLTALLQTHCRRGFCKAMLTSFINRMEENCDTVTLHSAAGLININTECHLDLLPHLTITSFHKCITCDSCDKRRFQNDKDGYFK